MEEVKKIFDECLNGDLQVMLNWNRDDIMKRYYTVYDACVGKPECLAEVSLMLIKAVDQFPRVFDAEEKHTRLEYMSFIFRYVRRRMQIEILQEDPFLRHEFDMDEDQTLVQILMRRTFAER